MLNLADPITMMAVAGLTATAAGGVTSAIGGSYASDAKAQMYQYQAGVAGINAKIAKENADYSRYTGEIEAEKSGMKTKFQTGTMKTAQAAHGLDVNTGSTKDARESQHDVGLFDQAIIRSNAARRAYGFEIEEAKYKAEGDMYNKASESTKKAGKLSMIGSLIGTAGSVASKWSSMSSSFGGGGGGGYAEDNKY